MRHLPTEYQKKLENKTVRKISVLEFLKDLFGIKKNDQTITIIGDEKQVLNIITKLRIYELLIKNK